MVEKRNILGGEYLQKKFLKVYIGVSKKGSVYSLVFTSLEAESKRKRQKDENNTEPN